MLEHIQLEEDEVETVDFGENKEILKHLNLISLGIYTCDLKLLQKHAISILGMF